MNCGLIVSAMLKKNGRGRWCGTKRHTIQFHRGKRGFAVGLLTRGETR